MIEPDQVDSISNLLTWAAGIAFLGTILARFAPAIAMTRSRRKATLIYAVLTAAFVCLAVVVYGLLPPFERGIAAFERQNWDEADSHLSAVQPAEAEFDSARHLLDQLQWLRGRSAFAADSYAVATSLLSAVPADHPTYDSAQAVLLRMGFFPAFREFVVEDWQAAREALSRFPEGHEKYDSAQILLRGIEMRRAESALDRHEWDEARSILDGIGADHQDYDRAQEIISNLAGYRAKVDSANTNLRRQNYESMAQRSATSPPRSANPRFARGCSDDGFRRASGHIYPGITLYYGEYRQFVGRVIVSTGRHEFDGRRERALLLQRSNGTTAWRKRDVINGPDWFVACDDLNLQ